MKLHNGDPIPPEMLEQLQALEAMPDSAIDFSDAPEALHWSKATRGKYYRSTEKQRPEQRSGDANFGKATRGLDELMAELSAEDCAAVEAQASTLKSEIEGLRALRDLANRSH
jgi:hypothetical protein